MPIDIVKKQLVYWAQISAAGALDVSAGQGLLAVGLVGAVFTLTMPANFTVPKNRRMVATQARGSNANLNTVCYREDTSTDATVVIGTFSAAAGAATAALAIAFIVEIYRIEALIGAGAG